MSSITFTCSACPVQAEGKLKDGRWWYFRYRWGRWTFSTGDDSGVMSAVAGKVFRTEQVSDGLDGWMEQEKAEDIIRKCIEEVELETES